MIHCFFHSVDLDGHCSGAIVHRKHPDCKLHGINYGDPFPWDEIGKDDTVYMVDFSLQPFSDMIRLKESCNLIWIDHHKSALDNAEKNDFSAEGNSRNGTAGCELTWEYIYPDVEMPRAVYLLGRYDVWDHEDPDTLVFQYGMRIYPNTFPQSDIWEKMLSDDKEFLNKTLKDGEFIIEYEKVQETKYCRGYSFETEIDGKKAIALNKGFASSKIFDSKWDPEIYDLMIVFHWSKKGFWKVSLYSTKEDVDVSAIAIRYDGGGHKGAAGFQIYGDLPFLKRASLLKRIGQRLKFIWNRIWK